MQNVITIARQLYTRLGILKRLPVRWTLALGWTLLATVMLVQSSGQPVVGPPAPPGAPDLRREIELTTGHLIVFSVLVILWWWALLPVLTEPRALFVAVGFALIFGVISELAQSVVPDRQVSLLDLAANWTATIALAVLISARWRSRRLPAVL